MRRRKLRLNNKGISTVVAEMLMIVIAVILATTFVVSLQSDVSSYVQNKQLASVYVWTTKTNGYMNITAANSGGDALDITGQVYIEYQNGVSQNIPAQLTFDGNSSTIDGSFSVRQVSFGQQFIVTIDTAQLNNGTIHYTISSKSNVLAEVNQNVQT